MSISQPVKQGDNVAYYIPYQIGTHKTQLRRVGTVKGWSDDKVIVLLPTLDVELVEEGALYLLD